jgi:hypothetical protein
MSVNIYKNGQKVRISVAFTVSDVATDPTTVTAKIKDPSGNVSTYLYGTDAALVKDSVGNYHVDVVTDENDLWHYRFEGTTACVAVEEGSFRVSSVFS